MLLDGTAIQGLSPQEINRRGLARSFQITNIFAGLSVFENVRLAVMRRHGLQYVLWRFANRLRAVRDETMQLLDRCGWAPAPAPSPASCPTPSSARWRSP